MFNKHFMYDNTRLLQYTLETFAESRSACWEHEPFKGKKLEENVITLFSYV